jgi:uncharacterized protein YcfL
MSCSSNACATLVVVLILSGFTACRSVNTLERAEPRAVPNYVDPRVEIPDRSLSRAVQLVDVREALAGDLRKIQVELFNSTNKTKHFQYRVEWFDDQGMAVRSPMSGWTVRSLLPKEQISITAIAPVPSAEDFRLKLLEAK